MARILDKIVQDDVAPSRSDLWLDGETLKANIHGRWKSISGGGSGAGVTIVDSIDKLDENAPVGSLAAVAVGGGSKYQTFSELCAMIPPISGDSTMTEEEYMEILKNLPIITDIKFNIPKKLLSEEIRGVLVLIPSEALDAGNMNLNKLMMISLSSEGVGAATLLDGETIQLAVITFNTETQTYELDRLALQEFNRIFKLKTWVFLGKDVLSSLIGELTPESIAAMDEAFSLLAGVVAQAELYIKKEEWQKVLIEDIEAIYAKLDTKQNIINKRPAPITNSLKSNTYYTDFVNNTNALPYKLLGHSTSSIYEEYIIELEIGNNAPSDVIFKNEDNEIIDIKWANSIAPILSPNTIYIISISGNYAVFAQFKNE